MSDMASSFDRGNQYTVPNRLKLLREERAAFLARVIEAQAVVRHYTARLRIVQARIEQETR